MRVRNLDKNWDWTFGGSQSDYVRNSDAVRLDIQMKIKEWYSDCFFALQNGIPWNVRLGSHNQQELLDKDIINVVQSVQGVLNIYNFESMVNGRRYRCSFDVFDQYSTETYSITYDSERGFI